MDVVSINVGEKLPEAFIRPDMGEGCQLYLSSAGRAVLCLFLNGMAEQEQLDLASLPIESAYLAVKGYWLGLIRIGDAIYELPFDPTEHAKTYGAFSSEIFNEQSSVYLLGVEMDGMVIRTLRLLHYPKQFAESLQKTLVESGASDNYTENYESIRSVLGGYPLWQLWLEAEKTGEFDDLTQKEGRDDR